MNLHIVPDSKFSDTFCRNLQELGLIENNKIIVRTNQSRLRYITHDLPFSKMYSSAMDRFIGETKTYDRVFIHQFSPLMFRWVAKNTFRELNWMIWGGDLYNLPFVDFNAFEPLTKQNYIKTRKDTGHWLYLAKLYLTNMIFMKKAYSKVNNVLTWMKSEYEFAQQHIPSLNANYQFFFYENQIPYHKLDESDFRKNTTASLKRKILVGNSGTATNNHLDAILSIEKSGIDADLYIPASYGDSTYINHLKRNASFYKKGSLVFMEKFMGFDEYFKFMKECDALVMNHIRPQGYGNIFMMMYLGKPVYLNPNNVSLNDLKDNGLKYLLLPDIKPIQSDLVVPNKEPLLELFSHEKLESRYRLLFG
ncbi:MAG TPA: TDP-N-acetylfucosamine:lipid II N-acetylfucosaminyltransferase [Ohtaekwangia sp.]|nr:TDP-N-acetylfucosamine:lipid II N-acetylfucosaminyltransferase [Ohtaekwangia sp.]